MKKLLRYLNTLLNVVVIATLAALVVLVFANVILRYFFKSGITWTVEVSGLLFVWLIFLGAVMAMRDYGHLGVDLLVARLPRGLQKVAFTFVNGVVVVLMVLLINGLLKMMRLNAGLAGSSTPIPVNVMYAAGLVAAILLIAISVTQVVRFVVLSTEAPPWAAVTTTGEETKAE